MPRKITSYKQRKAKRQTHTATVNHDIPYTNNTAPRVSRPAQSKYGYVTSNSIGKVAPGTGSHSRKPVTLPKISPGKSDEW